MAVLNHHANVLKGKEATFRVHSWGANPKHLQNAIQNHYYYRICYVIEGHGNYLERNLASPLFGGTIFCSRPGEWRQIQSKNGLSVLWVIFEIIEEESSEPFVQQFYNLRTTHNCIHTNADNTVTGNLWRALWTQAEHFYSQIEPRITAGLAYSLLMSFTQLFEETDNVKGRSNSKVKLIQQIREIINNNLSQPLRLQDLAQLLYISERHLSRLFVEDIGLSFSDYLRRERLLEAVQLLDRTDLTIEQISHKTGFGSAFYFSRVFSREMGIPPGRYRSYRK